MNRNAVCYITPLLLVPLLILSCGEKQIDVEVENNVRAEISSLQGYDAVQFNVRNGIVFLTGQCAGEGCARQLEEHIRQVEGVIAVENDITEGSKPDQ